MTEEQQLQKGFNAGYQLEKHAPNLSQTIREGFADEEHPYAQGFVAGSQEYVNEKAKEKTSALSKYMNPSSENNNSPESQQEKDFDLDR